MIGLVVCVRNPDRSPVGFNRRDTAQTPTGCLEIVGNDFPVFHEASEGLYLPLAEIALVLVRPDQVASIIVNANHSIM